MNLNEFLNGKSKIVWDENGFTVREHLICHDDTKISVQASLKHYSDYNEESNKYDTVEV